MALSEQEKQSLDEDGFVVLPNFMGDELLAELRGRVEQLFREEGDAAGAEFKQEVGARRLANLVNKGEVFQRLVADSRTLELVKQVLGDEIKLSSVNARTANPGFEQPQPLHADMGAVADERGYWVCNTVWMLDDFTAENGAIRAVPGSHRLGQLPQDALSDVFAPHPDEVLVTGRAGDVAVMNAHLWHGGLPNRTTHARTAVHVFYCRRDKPQQQYQKQLVDPSVQEQLSPLLRNLLALDDPANDQLSAQVETRSGFLE